MSLMNNSSNNIKFYEKYNLIPDLYYDLYIKDSSLSVRIRNALILNNILRVSELLRLSLKDLMYIRNLGKNSYLEIENYICNLDKTLLPIVKISKDKSIVNVISIQNEIYFHRQDIINGDFSFANEIKLADATLNQLQKYKNAFNDLGRDLIKICYNNSDITAYLSNILSTISTVLENYSTKNDTLLKILNRIPYKRRKRKALYYLDAYFYNKEISNKFLKYYNDNIDAKLEEFNFANLLQDQEDYYCFYEFLKWCCFDINNDINDFLHNIYSFNKSETVIKMRSNGISFKVIEDNINYPIKNIWQCEHATITRFKHNINLFNSIRSKIIADYYGNSKCTLEEVVAYFGEHSNEILYLLKKVASPKENIPKSIGEKIKYYRERYEYSIEDFSNLTSIPIKILNNYENKKNLPTYQDINYIEQVLNVKHYVFNLEQEIKKLSLGEKIKYYMLNCSITRNKMSVLLNIPNHILKNYEENKTLPSPSHLKQISELLCVDVKKFNLKKEIRSITISDRIKYYRYCCNITQKDLSEKTFISRRRISLIENGKANIKILELINIANALNLTYYELVLKKITTGNKIQLYREKAHLTKKDLSKLSGINYTRILNLESDSVKITIFDLIKIASVLKVEMADIYPSVKSNTKDMTLGEKIKFYRFLEDVSIRLLSEKSQLSQSYLRAIEKDIKKPSISALTRIANALNKDITVFDCY